MKENPVEHVRDILVQEIMTIEESQFEKEAIDMDSISFARKLWVKETIRMQPAGEFPHIFDLLLQ